GWPQNEIEGAFWNMSVDEAAAPLIKLIEKYRPQVIVTYDENGFYGHPDHIQANRITLFAANATGIAEKLYYPTIPKSGFARFREAIEAAGIDRPDPSEDEDFDFGTPDELITTFVDCREVVGQKHAALAAHG